MKVLVTGATGIAGSSAVPALVAAGHEVTAVARNGVKADQLRGWGATPIEVDLFDAAATHAAVVGHDGVCNLATHIPPLSKAARSSAWKENDRIRREVSANLIEAALASGVQRFVQESIGFLYADGGDAWLDERSTIEPWAATESALAAEQQVARFTASGGTGVVLRFAQFYGAGSTHTAAMVRMARTLRVGPAIGDPEAYGSSIHRNDLGPAVVAALGAPAGTYNVGDDEPLRHHELNAVFAAALGRRKLRQLGPWVAKVGGTTAKAVARSSRMSNAAFKAASGWEPTIPSARDGWPAIIAAGAPR